MSLDKKQTIKKPRGRIPKGKIWNDIEGKWDDLNPASYSSQKTIVDTLEDPLKINKIILTELDALRQKEFANNDKIRVMAYNKAIKIIKDHFGNTPITSGKQLKEYKGIGDKIANKVDEIIKNGVLESAEEARNDSRVKAINLFSEIHGIGPENAQKLVNLNITSIEQLEQRKDELQENNKPLLNKNQQLGLKYYKPLLERIPRSEMLLHQSLLLEILKSVNLKYPGTSIQVVGSFRRELDDSGDIDVLITNSQNKEAVFNLFIKKLQEEKYIIDVLGHGRKKFFGISKLNENSLPRRLDILYTTTQEFPFALLYFTGSGSFNTVFREFTNSKGYRLNEYKLQHYNPAKMPKLSPVDHQFKTEQDIFNFFKIPYIIPRERQGNRLTKELLPLK